MNSYIRIIVEKMYFHLTNIIIILKLWFLKYNLHLSQKIQRNYITVCIIFLQHVNYLHILILIKLWMNNNYLFGKSDLSIYVYNSNVATFNCLVVFVLSQRLLFKFIIIISNYIVIRGFDTCNIIKITVGGTSAW